MLTVLAAGFLARVLTGPTLSPLGQVAIRLVVPRLPFPERLVDGPPKRFAQGIGAALSTGAVVAYFAGSTELALVLVGVIALAAMLESVFGLCLGCVMFGALIRLGVIPETVCASCSDLSLRREGSATPTG